ncbi:MAG: hypothetical protein C4321_10745, partial [Chloroflexota bacterium]
APCPCHFEMDASLGHCDGTTGWRINSGHYGDVDLSGVTFVFQAFIGKNMVRKSRRRAAWKEPSTSTPAPRSPSARRWARFSASSSRGSSARSMGHTSRRSPSDRSERTARDTT